jgi:hypothetical protein
MYYYNYECCIYREHMVTIHERMRPLNNKSLFISIIYLLYIIFNYYLYIMSSRCCPNINSQKLAPKFYGPYTILKRVGPVSYQLALPNDSKLHLIFHVSCLKKVIGTKCQTQASLPKLDEEGSIWLQPQAVLDQRERRLRQRTIKEVLVQWKDTTPKMTPGSPPPFFNNFLISSLEDKVVFQGGGHVRDLTSLTPHIDRIIYFRCNKGRH